MSPKFAYTGRYGDSNQRTIANSFLFCKPGDKDVKFTERTEDKGVKLAFTGRMV